jgi:hypothetical protein
MPHAVLERIQAYEQSTTAAFDQPRPVALVPQTVSVVRPPPGALPPALAIARGRRARRCGLPSTARRPPPTPHPLGEPAPTHHQPASPAAPSLLPPPPLRAGWKSRWLKRVIGLLVLAGLFVFLVYVGQFLPRRFYIESLWRTTDRIAKQWQAENRGGVAIARTQPGWPVVGSAQQQGAGDYLGRRDGDSSPAIAHARHRAAPCLLQRRRQVRHRGGRRPQQRPNRRAGRRRQRPVHHHRTVFRRLAVSQPRQRGTLSSAPSTATSSATTQPPDSLPSPYPASTKPSPPWPSPRMASSWLSPPTTAPSSTGTCTPSG